MEEIITKAIKGGWIPKELLMWNTLQDATEVKTYVLKDEEQVGINYILNKNVCGARVKFSAIDTNVMFLDSKFWQSLKNWSMWAVCLTCGTKVPIFRECNCDDDEDTQPNPEMAWEWYWHKFIHKVATQGFDSAVEWLRGLLKSSDDEIDNDK